MTSQVTIRNGSIHQNQLHLDIDPAKTRFKLEPVLQTKMMISMQKIIRFLNRLPMVLWRFSSWRSGNPAICLILIIHFGLLYLFFAPAISTPDANGYFAQARLIAQNGRSDIVIENPAQYVGDHWMKVSEGHYYGQYPPGLPLLLAVIYRASGPVSSLWVLPVMATLSLLAVFLIVKQWSRPEFGILAASLMFFNPYANAHALGADSHTAVCFFLLWGLYGMIRWEQKKSTLWAAFSGFCLGMIPTIRYAEALLLIGPAVYVAMSWKPADSLRSIIAGLVSALVPISALAIRNQSAFGAFWRTGYSVSGEQTGFAISYFLRFTVPYLLMILFLGSGAVAIVGIRGIIRLTKQQQTKKQGILFLLLTFPIILLYFSYYFPANPKSMRFFLPTFYVYATTSALYACIRTNDSPEAGFRLIKRLFFLNLIWGLPLSLAELIPLKRDNRDLAQITAQLTSHLNQPCILITQSGILQHLDFAVDWRLAPVETFFRNPKPDRPLGPETFQPQSMFHDSEAQFVSKEPTDEQRAREFRQQISNWSLPDRHVFLLMDQNEMDLIRKRTDDSDSLNLIARIAIDGPRNLRHRPEHFEQTNRQKDQDERKTRGPRGGFFSRFLGPPGPPPEFEKGHDRPPFRKSGPGPNRGMRPPPRFQPPADGMLLLVEWKIGN